MARSSVLRRIALVIALAASLPAPRAFADGGAAPKPPAARAAGATLVIVADAPASKQTVAGLGGKLPEPWRLGDDAALRRALTAAGQRTPPNVALGGAASRGALVAKAREAARATGAQAVLFVRVTPKKGGRAVTLLLVGPGDTDAVLDAGVEVSDTEDGAAALLDVLTPSLASLAPPGPPAEPGAPAANVPATRDGAAGEPPSPASTLTASPPLGSVDRAILVLSAGGGTGARIFRYHDGLSPQLRTYDLAASPNLVLSAEVYPFARSSVPVVRGLGITGGLQHALGVSSQASSGAAISTHWLRVEGGLRLRLAFGDEARFLLGVHGGVVKERFGFQGDETLRAWLPDVDYLFWRAGADGRLRVGPLALLAGAAYLPAIEGGALADRFRGTGFAAVELGGGVAVPLVRVFEVRATAVYTRVFYAFHPEPGDLYVAGGALDHLVRAQLSATLLL